MNKFMGMGRLTRDPEVRTSQTGTMVARYALAIDRVGDGTDFIDCVAFGKTAEFVDKYLRKGMKIAVSGSIQTGSYEKDGKKVKTYSVVVNEHWFCESRKETEKPMPSDEFMTVADAELPFV